MSVSFTLTYDESRVVRRAAHALDLGPCEFAREATLHAAGEVLKRYPDAEPGPPSRRGRPRKGETAAEARVRREGDGG